MPKIKYKNRTYYGNEDEQEEIYEVYGVRTYKQKQIDYESSWIEEVTEFYIYSYSSWSWADAKNYEPVNEGKE